MVSNECDGAVLVVVGRRFGVAVVSVLALSGAKMQNDTRHGIREVHRDRYDIVATGHTHS